MTHTGNEKASQSKSLYDRAKPQRDDQIVNLSTLWCQDVTEILLLCQEYLFYKDSDEDQTDKSIESNMSMNDDNNGEQKDCLNAVVTKAKIADMDRKIINAWVAI